MAGGGDEVLALLSVGDGVGRVARGREVGGHSRLWWGAGRRERVDWPVVEESRAPPPLGGVGAETGVCARSCPYGYVVYIVSAKIVAAKVRLGLDK